MKSKIVIYSALIIIGALIGAGGYHLFLANSTSNDMHNHETADQLYTCGMHPNIIEEQPGDCPICGMKLNPIKSGSQKSSGERKIIYWRAPMNPNEVYDSPGKSQMGMDLVPVYEDEGGATGVVTVDGSVMQSMNVKIEHVKIREISSEIVTNGILSADERLDFTINTKIGGWIENLYVNFTGQKVKKGEPLVDIYSPELVSAQQELLTAVAYREALRSSSNSKSKMSGDELFNNAVRKLELFDITQEDIDRLIETKNVTKVMTIYAPFDGTVISKNVDLGEKVSAGKVIVKMSDLSNLWLIADIFESELGKVELGSTAEVNFSYNPDKSYKGKVSFIYPTIDPKTRTARLRIDIKNYNDELKPAMFGNAKIMGKKYGMQPTVPETAILRSGKKNIVIFALGEGKFKPVEVKLGYYTNGYYQVLSGVKDGDMIVTSAQFMIDSESSLRSAVKLFSSSDAAEHENMKMNDDKSEPEIVETQNMKMNDASGSQKMEMKDESTETKMDMKSHSPKDHAESIVREGIIDLESIDANKDGKLFQDIMDWNVISDEPGRCPVCNMKLQELTINEVKKNLNENGFEYK